METNLLLMIYTGLHRYIVRRDHVHELRLVMRKADLERPDLRGKQLVSSDLGRLLDPLDPLQAGRCYALIVHMRRRGVALLARRVEDVYIEAAAHDSMQSLPPLLTRNLQRPWLLGVVVWDDIPILVLDMRQIAQDVLLTYRNMG